MAMRDKEGRTLSNAHLLGFLWRILKLLFYGIRPVFVFDGGAPVQKRRTLADRKHKRTHATESLAKAAEKLLAAQLRQAALEQVHGARGPSRPELEEGTVYYDDVGRSNEPPTSGRATGSVAGLDPSRMRAQRQKDPYQLPALTESLSTIPERKQDLRFASEAELRSLMDQLAPEDLDTNSELFQSLPPELQYELVGDLRAQSRGTSYQRLQDMLASAPTPIDFSRAQIAGLRTRNDLTQKVLTVTDEIGNANIQVPIRVAGQRNREYVLVHIEGGDGGYALGTRDAGTTQDKAINVEKEEERKAPVPHIFDDDDTELLAMEDVEIPEKSSTADPALDALVHLEADPVRRKERALAMLGARAEHHRRQVHTESGMEANEERMYGHTRVHAPSVLFHDGEVEEVPAPAPPELSDGEWDDVDVDATVAATAVPDASADRAVQPPVDTTVIEVGSSHVPHMHPVHAHTQQPTTEDEDELLQGPLVSVHAAAEAPVRIQHESSAAAAKKPPAEPMAVSPAPAVTPPRKFLDTVRIQAASASIQSAPSSEPSSKASLGKSMASVQRLSSPLLSKPKPNRDLSPSLARAPSQADPMKPTQDVSWEKKKVEVPMSPPKAPSTRSPEDQKPLEKSRTPSPIPADTLPSRSERVPTTIPTLPRMAPPNDTIKLEGENGSSRIPAAPGPSGTRGPARVSESPPSYEQDDSPRPETEPPREMGRSLRADTEPAPFEWSPTPSPEPVALGPDGFPLPSLQEAAAMEAEEEAEEAQLESDGTQFATFLSTTSGRNLNDVQQEVQKEVHALHQERARLRRSEEDVTVQMATEVQALLRLFGLPYITAPMEAEAQCAQLATQNLVDGIITDDSDVFLFGGTPVYRNMFNNKRTVECYVLRDLQRELSLDRNRLIQLAFLLGSDYTAGLAGVGPVLAMEILSLYPGEDGLEQFRAWWQKVQVGAENDPNDGKRKVRSRIKRALRDRVHLSEDWPNPSERQAYVEPVVDASEEPFVWGHADLDALRGFLSEYLHWPASKTDQYVLPAIEQQRKAARLNRVQATLDQAGFVSGRLAGAANPIGSSAPMYGSARLQQVVNDFRSASQRRTEPAPESTALPKPRKRRAPRSSSGSEEEYTPQPRRGARSTPRTRGQRASLHAEPST